MIVETDDPDRHRLHVSTHRGTIRISEYVSPTPGERVDGGPTVKMIFTPDEALRVADALVDAAEHADHGRPAAAQPLQLLITLDAHDRPIKRTRKRPKRTPMPTTPIAIVLIDSEGAMTTHPLVPGSWSGSGYRAAVELDGERVIVSADVTSA